MSNRATFRRIGRSAAPSVRHALAAAAIAALLAACGGGSDSSDPETPPDGGTPPPAAGFTITLDIDRTPVLQGDHAMVQVHVQRDAGFSEAVQIRLIDAPDGVSAPTLTVAAGQTDATLRLDALATAPHSLPTGAKVQGSAAGQSVSKPLTVTVRGLPGALDTSFASQGLAVDAVATGEDIANAVAVQADGRIVMAGSSSDNLGTHISLMRRLRDGSVDTGFGSGGHVLVPLDGTTDEQATALAIQPDGKILVAGSSARAATGRDFVLRRYLASGQPDTAFGQNGRVLVDFGGTDDQAWSLLVMPDGRIVLGGDSNRGPATSGRDFALARLKADGSLDAGFGDGGRVITAIRANSATDIVRALALQPVGDQTYLVAVGGEGDFVAARYRADGGLDAGFGNGGRIEGLFGDIIGSARSVLVLADGGLVLGGQIGHRFAAAQLHADGSLDTAFGPQHDGLFVQALNPVNWSEATALVRQADGALLLGGWVYAGNSSAGDFAALRLLPAGVVDTAFGQDGVSILAVAPGTKSDLGQALVLQADERVSTVRALLAGQANDANNDFALLRLWL